MDYSECPIFCKINKKNIPLTSIVPLDEFTYQAQLNFDYEFEFETISYINKRQL